MGTMIKEKDTIKPLGNYMLKTDKIHQNLLHDT